MQSERLECGACFSLALSDTTVLRAQSCYLSGYIDSGAYRIPVPTTGGNPAIPSGAQVPVASLTPGSYRLVLNAIDTAGNKSQRLADFEVQ